MFSPFAQNPYLCGKTKDMLEKEFNYFKVHHDELFAEYPNKYVVIKDGKVMFAGDTFEAALQQAVQSGLEVGTFLIQLCSEGEEGYTQTFHSRVVFS
jgi:carbamoylphosphate synthase large subunit